jgi:hypothetical protein
VRVDAQANNPLKLLHTTPLPDFKTPFREVPGYSRELEGRTVGWKL